MILSPNRLHFGGSCAGTIQPKWPLISQAISWIERHVCRQQETRLSEGFASGVCAGGDRACDVGSVADRAEGPETAAYGADNAAVAILAPRRHQAGGVKTWRRASDHAAP